MEKLMEELKNQIKIMNRKNVCRHSLGDGVLDHLYSVYPFNKFEYIISHLTWYRYNYAATVSGYP